MARIAWAEGFVQARGMKRLFASLRFQLALLLAITSLRGAELIPREWTVDGLKREGLVHEPLRPPATGAPVVFVFHGHGGSMRQAARSMPVHEQWPEALVVYLQGLPTPGRLTDPDGKLPGWQMEPGDQADRDVKAFDEVWRSLQTAYKVDPQRVYAMGHSNGGSFTYLLWAKRSECFAAFGPSAAVAGPRYGPLVPRPVIHVAGKRDELVKFAWQQRMIESLRHAQARGVERSVGPGITIYDSDQGTPVETYVHEGSHQYPAEATALIIAFFKQHPLP
jgi:polyhydroxybutyrate depolymerase